MVCHLQIKTMKKNEPLIMGKSERRVNAWFGVFVGWQKTLFGTILGASFLGLTAFVYTNAGNPKDNKRMDVIQQDAKETKETVNTLVVDVAVIKSAQNDSKISIKEFKDDVKSDLKELKEMMRRSLKGIDKTNETLK